ncbi:MAG: TRAP transporter small permease [Bacteroidota bacterium]
MRLSLDRYLGYFLAGLMALITVDVLWGVFTRYALGNQAGWTEELARFLLIWIGLLGTAWASGQRMHLSITLLPDKLEGKARRRLLLFIDSLVVLFALSVMIIGGGHLVWLTYELGQTSAALKLPMGLIYSVIPISGVLIVFYKLNDLNTQL